MYPSISSRSETFEPPYRAGITHPRTSARASSRNCSPGQSCSEVRRAARSASCRSNSVVTQIVLDELRRRHADKPDQPLVELNPQLGGLVVADQRHRKCIVALLEG